MKLKTDLTWIPVQTDDAEFRLKMFWRLLAQLVIKDMVAAGQDGKSPPEGLPQESDMVPSSEQHTANVET